MIICKSCSTVFSGHESKDMEGLAFDNGWERVFTTSPVLGFWLCPKCLWKDFKDLPLPSSRG